VKKFLATMLMGAFLFASMAATIGCGDSDKDKKTEKKTESTEKKTDKP